MLSMRAIFPILIFVSCAATHPPRPWRVELATAGGIAGKGTGQLSVDSAGHIEVRMMNDRQCTYQATPDELTRIEHALAAAKPSAWRESYLPENICCDRLEWTVTTTMKDEKHSSTWIDDSVPMPADLKALATVLGAHGEENGIRTRAIAACARESR